MTEIKADTKIVSISEASEILGISETAVYENIRKDNLVRIDGITLSSVEELKSKREARRSRNIY